MRNPLVLGLLAASLLITGCAFDVVHVNQVPTVFSTIEKQPDRFVLLQPVKARLGTGFPTLLRSGTSWRQIGICSAGLVYRTDDQIVKVEASNIYEARIVVQDGQLVGFYLPVERTFAPTSRPLPLKTKHLPPT